MSVHVSSKQADGASRLPATAWLVLGIVLVADIMDLLDSTITTIAASTISSSLHGGPGLIKWLGASYALALGVLLVTGGRLGDKYGRRRIFLIGITGFTAASLACGLAWDPPSIIVARLVQGAFGALLIPQGFGILGSALLAGCMLGLLFGLIQGSTDGWTAAPVAALAAGVIFFAAFAQRQRTAAVPLIKPSLLRNRGFTAGLILGLVFFATVAGLLYAVSLFLQRGVGDSPERAAVTGSPRPPSGSLSRRWPAGT
jgi:MFS family permease